MQALLAAVVIMIGGAQSGCGEAPRQATVAGPAATPPVSWPSDARLSVPATIGGRPAVMLLDTGSPCQSLFRPADFGATVQPGEVVVHGIDTGCHPTTPVTTQILGQDFGSVIFAFVNIGEEKDGFLGWNFMAHWVTTLDWSRWSFSIASRLATAPAGWQEFAIAADRSRLWLIVPVAGAQPLQVMLDTGDSGGAYVDQATWERFDQPGSRTCVLSLSAYGFTVEDQVVCRELPLGSLVLRDITMSPSVPLLATDAEQRQHPLRLGLHAMRQFDWVIDGPGHRCFIRRSLRAPEPARLNRLGAVFMPAADGSLAARVMRGSPAERAGIHDGDQLLAIDGQAIHPILMRDANQPDQLAELVTIGRLCTQPAGTILHLSIQEHAGRRDLAVTLQDLEGATAAAPSATPR